MKAVFCRHGNLGSLLLRTCMWSSWSHCAIVTVAGTVIEARAFKGVTERPLRAFLDEASDYAFKDIAVEDDARAEAFARAQIGKPYDWFGAVGLGLHREWEQPDAWFCSELVEGAVVAGQRRRFVNQVKRITPQLAWMVA
jgi:uncharacterized protein YycO